MSDPYIADLGNARTLPRGKAWRLYFEVFQNGAALDVSGASYTFTLKMRPRGAESTVFTLATDDSDEGGKVSGDPNGIIFFVSAADSAAIQKGLWDVELHIADSSTTPATDDLYGRGTVTVYDLEAE